MGMHDTSRIVDRAATVFGIRFSTLSVAEIADMTSQPFMSGQCRRIYTVNVDHVVKLRSNPVFRAAYADAWLATADGTPVWLYARWRSGAKLKRVTGADLLPAVLRRLDPERVRPAFFCATDQIAVAIRRDMVSRGFADDGILVEVPPHGFESDDAVAERLAASVREHGTTHLFLGVGAPRSEIWAWRWREVLGPCYVFPVGAGIAFHLRMQKRAPAVMRQVGLEWSWRLMQEPRRLARRYMVQSWPFFAAIRDDMRAHLPPSG